ncbi:hypothetical protein E0L36_22160 [Streptomyces sp. AJS327]|uniref:hypothetical protein n=1 Tax=Streptomyces sp. AJS327 TaxID=2545265 RepID=UPI0015DD99DC|nr:hypothetical protein [Streptomyces sp. AJS327]MBA0053482.1 hypothetical protein [Streptomyces sp. AJS327]
MHDRTNEHPDESGEFMPPLPPYSGELTVCVKCSHNEAFTYYRPACPRAMHDRNGRMQQRGPLPERLERACQRCDYSWDEALVPAEGIHPATVENVARALQECAPYPVNQPAATYTAERLLGVAHVLLRADHPMWATVFEHTGPLPAEQPTPPPTPAGLKQTVPATPEPTGPTVQQAGFVDQ